MRKPITIFCLFLLLVLMNCETERVTFNGPYFVRFTEASGTEKESYTEIIEVEVHQSMPVLDEDITITYKISGDAREGIDYTILGDRGRVTILKGEYVGTIQIQLINNANNIIRSQDVVFTLQSVNTDKLQVGQDVSAMGSTYTFTIVDDCILSGTYTGKRGSYTDSGITIASSDCENYILSNWNLGKFIDNLGAINYYPSIDLEFVDNGDNSLTIPKQEKDLPKDEKATIIGFGSEDPLTHQITLTITLVNFGGEQLQIKLTRE